MMTAEEVGSILEKVLNDHLTFPWWNYLIVIVLSFVGSFFGSYWKRRGEDFAANRNFERLTHQLETTTQKTEEIRLGLSGEFWRTQQYWSARQKYYIDVLTHLQLLRNALEDQEKFYREPGSEDDQGIQKIPRFKQLTEANRSAYEEIRKLSGPASLYLSPKATESILELFKSHEYSNEFSLCTAEYVNELLKHVVKTQEEILREAKSDTSRM